LNPWVWSELAVLSLTFDFHRFSKQKALRFRRAFFNFEIVHYPPTELAERIEFCFFKKF
jgi:hypothetical protein